MIFGGYGRKSKVRGEVFFPCSRCSALNTFALLENYGYGQLYGVRLAKYKTDRFMLCSLCQDGYPLDKQQWEQAQLVAQGLKARGHELPIEEMAQSAVELARKIYPDVADSVREMLWEQLGEPQPVDAEADDHLTAYAELESGEDSKVCPDCAEQVKAAARKCRFCGYRFEPDLGSGAALDPAG